MRKNTLASFLAGCTTIAGIAAAVDCFTAHSALFCALGGWSVSSYPPCEGCADSQSGNSTPHFKMNSPPGGSGRTDTGAYSSCQCTFTMRWCTPQGECQVKEGYPVSNWYTSYVPEGGDPCTVPNSGGGGSPD